MYFEQMVAEWKKKKSKPSALCDLYPQGEQSMRKQSED